MPWIDLRTGYRCNNRCRFCDQGDRRTSLGDASFEQLHAALVEARSGGADAVWLAGGEVTLRPDLPRLVSAARALGFGRVGVQTNGRILATAGAATALRSAGLTDAIVALHAATPDLHDWLTQEPGSWKQAVAGVRQLTRAGVETRINTVLTRSGASEIPALAALVARLGVLAQRWIHAREHVTGFVVPRFELVREPLVDAIAAAWDARREVETSGVPLCVLGEQRAAAADRLDHPEPLRMSPLAVEPRPPRVYGPPCAECPLASACPGVDLSYVQRFGWDEIGAGGHLSEGLPPSPGAPVPTPGAAPGRAARPIATRTSTVTRWTGGDPVPGVARPYPRVILAVEAACPLPCPCTTRDAYARMYTGVWPTELERRLRQRLVRAASEGAATVVFAGASPWAHPGLPGAVREARRLGFVGIEVWGPIEPLDTLEPASAEKLAGLTRILAPRLGVAPERFAEALCRLTTLCACPVELYDPTEPSSEALFHATGPAAVWAPCQPGRNTG